MTLHENPERAATASACEVRSMAALGAAISQGLSPAEFLGFFSDELSVGLPHHHVNVCLLTADREHFVHLGAAFRDPPYHSIAGEPGPSIWSGLRAQTQYALERFTIRHAIRSGRSFRFDDYASDPLVLETNNEDELRLMQRGLRYGLIVPLRTVDSVFGVMCCGRGRPYEPFDDQELALAESVTDRVAPLIQTFRQYRLELDLREEMERQRDFLAHLNAISRVVAGSTDEGVVLATFAKEIRKRIACEGLEVRLLRPSRTGLMCRVFTADEANAWSYVGERSAQDGPGSRVLLHQVPMEIEGSGAATILTVPLNARSETIGVISFRAPANLADPRTADAARMFADQLGPYLASAHMAHDAQQRDRDSGASGERSRLAQAIHDSVIQDLIGARRLIAEDPEGAEGVLDGAIEQSRALLWNLRTREITQQQLATLLLDELDAVGAELGAEVTSEIAIAPDALDARQATVLHAVAKQLLANVRRHSAARTCSLRLVAEGTRCRLEIADDGIGMPAGSHEHRPRMDGGGAGLFIVRERVVTAGGELHIRSSNGRGTTVVATVPLAHRRDAPPLEPLGAPEAILVETSDYDTATVLIIDDHQVVREGLRRVLTAAEGLVVVGEAGDGVAGIRLAVSLKPDIVVVDLHLPHRSGVEVIRALSGQIPGTRLLATSAFDDLEASHEMLAAGAHAFVSKSASSHDLVRTLRALLEPAVPGRVTASPQVMLRPAMTEPGLERIVLSQREQEILDLMCTDLTYREIGLRLFISGKTVQYHVHNLYNKLGVRSRAAAVARAATISPRV